MCSDLNVILGKRETVLWYFINLFLKKTMKTNWELESLKNSLDKKDGTFILQEPD